MNKNYTLLMLGMLIFTAFQLQAQHTVYPGVTDLSRLYQAPKTATPPVINGDHTDAVWNIAPWKQAFAVSPIATDWTAAASLGTPVAPEGEFSGAQDVSFKYKIIWDDNHYYMLMRWTDDKVIYADNHPGYAIGLQPSFVTATTSVPAVGGGDGTAFQNWRMDAIAFWLTPHTDGLADGTTQYNRANNGLLHNFYPAKLTAASTQAEAVLWSARHNPVSTTAGAPQTHKATVAAKFIAEESAYYIEFRDSTWSALFTSVRTKVAGQKDYSAVPPAIGDKFLFQGEINDADGTTNRRDYVLYTSHMSLSTVLNPLQRLTEAMVIELVDQVSSVKTASSRRNLEFYPNPNPYNTLMLSRIADVEIFNLAGQRVIQSINTLEVNISGLQPGIYMVKDKEGNVGKLVRK